MVNRIVFGTAACIALLATQANAAFVIGNFSGSDEFLVTMNDPDDGVASGDEVLLDDDATGRLTAVLSNATTLTSGDSASADSGDFDLKLTSGTTFSLDYYLDNAIDLHSMGAFAASPLALDLFGTVTGALDLVATYYDASNNTASTGVMTISSPGKVFLPGSAFGNGAVASAVKRIGLQFTPHNSSGATFKGTLASVAATPEPMSFALLGASCLCGFGGLSYRRRRRTVDVVA